MDTQRVDTTPSIRRTGGRWRIGCFGAVFLVLGAIATIAVSWTAALYSPVRTSRAYWDESEREVFDLEQELIFSLYDNLPSHHCVAQGLGWRRDEWINLPATPVADRAMSRRSITIAGWPVHAMQRLSQCIVKFRSKERWWERTIKSTSDDGIATLWIEGIRVRPSRQVPVGGDDRCNLPLRPMLFGFVFDTLFYATVFAVPWLGVSLIRRRRRARRGLCASCGYPLSPSSRCPECGHARTITTLAAATARTSASG